MTRQLKQGLTLNIQTRAYGGGIGETFYIICDSVGLVFQTIFPDQLNRFYEDTLHLSVQEYMVKEETKEKQKNY